MSVKALVCFLFKLLLSSEKTRSAAPEDGMTRARSCAASQYPFKHFAQLHLPFLAPQYQHELLGLESDLYSSSIRRKFL